jgi:hypothetical protein
VKNALLLLASTCSVSEEIALEKRRPFLTGGGQAATSPASEDSLRKAIRQEKPKARKAKNPMLNRG